MKHVQDDLKPTDEPNLRNAFSPVPPDVREMLVQTARSVKEEEEAKTRKYRLSPALLAAVLVFATMSVGLAVSEHVGWSNFFSQAVGRPVPSPMQQVLNQAEHAAYELGPITFTVEEALCDGKTIIVSVSARMTDGSAALLAPSAEVGMPIVYNDPELTRLGLEEDVTYLEAAQQKGLPLYGVHALPQPGQFCNGDQYEEYLHDADGALIDFSGFTMDPEFSDDTVPVELFLYVYAIDPETGKITQTWQDRPQYTVQVNRSILAEKTYLPQEPLETAEGCRLESVRMELRVTGAYVYIAFTAGDAVDHESEDWREGCYNIGLVDENGQELPFGVSLSGDCDDSAWPAIVMDQTLMLDALPDVIGVKLSYSDETIHLLK